jgi:hypothetical protein
LRAVQEARAKPDPDAEHLALIRKFVGKVANRSLLEPDSPQCQSLLEELFNYDLDKKKEKDSGKGLYLTGKTLPGEWAYLFRVDYRQRDFKDYVEPWEARLAEAFAKAFIGKLAHLWRTNEHLLRGAKTRRPTEDIVYDPPDIKVIVSDS